MAEHPVVGKGIPLLEGLEKVTGEAIYSTDIQLPVMLFGKIRRSPYPFAKILSINTDKASRIPGVNVVQFPYGSFVKDELPLADKYARYAGDAVAAVAAIDVDTAEEALDLIDVEYEELSPVLDAEQAMAPGAPAVHQERKEDEASKAT